MKLNLNAENINYIKITYKDKNDFTHCTKAAVRRIDEQEIYLSAKFENGLFINTPQEIGLSIATDIGLYKSVATLKYITYDAPYVFFSIKSPKDIDYQQKREFFRVKMTENATISYMENNKEVVIACNTYDISANGSRLLFDKEYDLPDVVQLKLYLPDKTIFTNAQYVRTDYDDNILKLSFTFLDIKESDLDYISQICLKKQIEQRRKLL